MAKKVGAVLLMCIVVFAAVQIQEATAEDDDSHTPAPAPAGQGDQNNDDGFVDCFRSCHKDCTTKDGHGSTYCEMKCDADCVAKQTTSKLGLKWH